MNNRVVIVGAAYSDIRRRSELTVGQLAVQAADRALEAAGLQRSDIDGLANFPSPSRPGAGSLDGVDIVSCNYLAQAMGMSQVQWHTSLTRGSFTGSLAEAVNAVRAGACTYALVWRAMRNPPGRYGRVMPGPAAGDDAFTAPYGFSNEVVKASMIYSRYMSKYGTTRADMAKFAVSNRLKASAHPSAVFRGQPLTVDDYMTAQMVADPMSMLDCDMAVDGCSAVVVTSEAQAAKSTRPPVLVEAALNLGIPTARRNFYLLEDFQRDARHVVERTLDAARMSADDIEHLELYDGFVYFPWLWMEALGVCAEGEAAGMMTEAETGSTGRLPLNTSGGSLGMGRIHGGAQVVEAVQQLQGSCGERQKPSLGPTLVTSGSPLTGCGSLILAPYEP